MVFGFERCQAKDSEADNTAYEEGGDGGQDRQAPTEEYEGSKVQETMTGLTGGAAAGFQSINEFEKKHEGLEDEDRNIPRDDTAARGETAGEDDQVGELVGMGRTGKGFSESRAGETADDVYGGSGYQGRERSGGRAEEEGELEAGAAGGSYGRQPSTGDAADARYRGNDDGTEDV